ncbi:MAG TPA: response regulator [Methylibium sp.]|uniref:response regulator n=1 Tax=Methylibium sp. TaxID=2067992 RepID=UPI002DB6434A|nr:response regulator [Methylibium sp.]HEU4458474.1 response regulator [Methylibium sp.]
MNTRYRVALQGFGPFERRALESCLRLTSRAPARFEPAESLDAADLCVVDGDRPQAVDEVRRAGRMERAVFVGAEPPSGAIVHLGRPINPQQVVRALETLLLAASTVADPYAPASAPAAAPDKPRAPAREPAPRPPPVVHFPFDVLVLEGRHTASSPLIAQLDRVGCRVSVARDDDEALQLIAQTPVRIVFSDTQMRGVDGMALCQQIKSARKGAPSVVLMAPKVTASDRVRAQLAGADALMGKPIPADDLLEVLRTASNRRRRAR